MRTMRTVRTTRGSRRSPEALLIRGAYLGCIILKAFDTARAATSCINKADLDIDGTYLCFESSATGTIYVDEVTGEVVPYETAVGAVGYEPVVWYEASNLTTPRGATPGSLTSTFINAGTWAWVNVTRGVADSAESPQPANAFTVNSGNFEVSGTQQEEFGDPPRTVQVDTYVTVPERSRGERQTCVLHYAENSGTCVNLAAQGNPIFYRFVGNPIGEPCDVDFLMIDAYNIGGPAIGALDGQAFADQFFASYRCLKNTGQYKLDVKV